MIPLLITTDYPLQLEVGLGEAKELIKTAEETLYSHLRDQLAELQEQVCFFKLRIRFTCEKKTVQIEIQKQK